MTRTDLKEYLRRVFLLEQSLYQQQQLAGQIHEKVRAGQQWRGESLKLKYSKWDILKGSRLKDLCTETFFVGIATAVVYVVIWFFLWDLDSFKTFLGALATILIVSIGFFLLSVLKYTRWADKENKKIEEQNSVVRTRNQQTSFQTNRVVGILQQEVKVLEHSILQTKRTLSQYYAKNIIFPKYREIIAVSSFYEYLSSGRCSTLEGHEGAYNIFENESRQNLIIRKLDDIITRLDRIEENQYMLYSAIQNSQRETSRMLTALNRTAQSIESNAAVTAYNSQITAQNTECLKWLAVMQV